ncbi:MAG: D-glycero-beta-D-manno-heptose 1-phosphate adenylyltransferase [Bacteroidales bacterium]|nr:D-glycero-beta-D-manno-heptose 1-phosphate adenylyltransferase [Bacteroidales bacterium]
MDKLNIIQSKIIDINNIESYLTYWKLKNQKIVFTNGCFDILHRGHVEYLAQAANHGDVLIIGVNTDSSVRRIKGETRPVQDEYARSILLASLSFVSAIVLFDDDTPYNLIKRVQPDVLIKGSDYSIKDIIGSDIVIAKGGKVITIDFIEGYSTTSIIEKLKKD